MQPTIPRSSVAILVLLAMTTSGCAVLYPRWHECHRLTSTPLRLGVTIMSAPRTVYGYEVRASASVALHEGGGLSLYLYNPQGSFSFKPGEIRRCQRLGQAETQSWTHTIDRMTAELEQRRGEVRDVIFVTRADGTSGGLAAIEDLEPEALAAVRALACLAAETFGKPGERSFREVSPLLASRLDFPATCVSW